MKWILCLTLSFNFFIIDDCFALPKKNQFDICVYGASASGVMAAIQSGRSGKKVVLISTINHVGGLPTSGLTATDMNRNIMIGGLAREFYQRVYNYYLDPAVWKNQTREEFFIKSRKRTYTGKNDKRKMQCLYESKVSESIMLEMLKEAGVMLILNDKLDLKKGVKKRQTDIVSIKLESGKRIKAKIFIDASYTGDLLAQAGVSYVVGREDNKQYNETLNGYRVNYTNMGYSTVSPYVRIDNTRSGILPYIDSTILIDQGTGDKRVQAYCYRLTLTDDPANRIKIMKPKDYNPAWYEVLVRYIIQHPKISLQDIITLTPMPNRKTDTNHLDFFGANYGYPEGDYKERKKIERLHKSYALGMLWLLEHDPRIPEHIRSEMSNWGLAKDEFEDTGNFPPQIYVREARRMIGEFVMTEKNVIKGNRTPASNSIAIGTYALDCHYVSKVIDDEGKLRLEGTIFKSTTPYPISYYSITPKRNECDNLLVPVCLSASHVAYSSIRMEPQYMVLGQSAAVAAVMAIDSDVPVQDISYDNLAKKLVVLNQVLNASTVKEY